MKAFIRLWLIAILLAGPGAAFAGHCRAVRVVQQKVVVVEKAVAVAVVAPVVAQFVPVAVPVYSAFYQPAAVVAPGAAAAAPDCEQKLAGTFRELGSLLKQLDSRLQRLEGGPGTVPPQVPPAGPQPPRMPPADGAGKPSDPFNQPTEPQTSAGAERLLALSVRHCSNCHDQSRAQVSGGKFVLLEGGKFSANLQPESLGKLIDELASKRMPKGGQMSEADRLLFISLLVSGK